MIRQCTECGRDLYTMGNEEIYWCPRCSKDFDRKIAARKRRTERAWAALDVPSRLRPYADIIQSLGYEGWARVYWLPHHYFPDQPSWESAGEVYVAEAVTPCGGHIGGPAGPVEAFSELLQRQASERAQCDYVMAAGVGHRGSTDKRWPMSKQRYYMSNGYHNTETYVLVEPRVGAIVSGRVIVRAAKRLCGMSDCMCTTSPASDAREGQREGFIQHPRLVLEWEPREPASLLEDYNRHIVRIGDDR